MRANPMCSAKPSLRRSLLVATAVSPRLLEELAAAESRAYLSGMTAGSHIEECAHEAATILKPLGKGLLDAINKRGGAARIDTFPA